METVSTDLVLPVPSAPFPFVQQTNADSRKVDPVKLKISAYMLLSVNIDGDLFSAVIIMIGNIMSSLTRKRPKSGRRLSVSSTRHVFIYVLGKLIRNLD